MIREETLENFKISWARLLVPVEGGGDICDF